MVLKDGPMAKEIDLSNSRDPEFVFDTHVQKMLNEIHNGKALRVKIIGVPQVLTFSLSFYKSC